MTETATAPGSTDEARESEPVTTPASVLDRARASYKRQVERPKHLDLQVPGWDGNLVVRYRPLAWERLNELLDQADDGDSHAELMANISAILEACDALLIRDDTGELVSVGDLAREAGQEITTINGEVCFDHTTADALDLAMTEGQNRTSARDVLFATFRGAVSPEVAISQHATAIALWMRGVSQEVGAKVGEDSGTRPRSS